MARTFSSRLEFSFIFAESDFAGMMNDFIHFFFGGWRGKKTHTLQTDVYYVYVHRIFSLPLLPLCSIAELYSKTERSCYAFFLSFASSVSPRPGG